MVGLVILSHEEGVRFSYGLLAVSREQKQGSIPGKALGVQRARAGGLTLLTANIHGGKVLR